MLKLENIVAGYGHITALKDISLEVPQGSIVSLIGANGAGKSTLIEAILGYQKIDRGKIYLFGKELSVTNEYEISKKFHIQLKNHYL